MTKGLPCHKLFAKRLHGLRSEFQRMVVIESIVTHASNLPQVAINIGPQHLDCNLLPLVFTLEHITISTTAQCDARRIVA